ncbi:T9SS type A sorting domain-containing protein [Flammeovirga sp. MY04]|uniref:T9SS type A sorting domain-containing protein n=1 Tax=Flammeovirga sp. MY04 TaxID=1191459 RepID=UPI0008061E05|nr:T9SS type A sorting domain-containing protein [Flammeovirga sp. MY04]ANQ51724.1 T9SS type A sorting domain-containing protein [Flammeovirga sp. MY04]
MKKLLLSYRFIAVFLAITLSYNVHAQENFTYLKSNELTVGEVGEIDRLTTSMSGDPEGLMCDEVYKFIRSDAQRAYFEIDLKGSIDFSNSTEIKLNLFTFSPESPVTNTSLAIALFDAEGGNETLAYSSINNFDQWEEYTFDFNGINQDVEFTKVRVFLIFQDEIGESDKMKFFVDRVSGPFVKQEMINTAAQVSEDGRRVKINFLNHTDFAQFFNPTFKVFNEAGTELAVRQTSIQGSSIELLLSEAVQIKEKLTYSFVSGTISDVDGVVLSPFAGKEVMNHSKVDETTNLLYKFGQPSLLNLGNPYLFTLEENAQDPANPSEVAGKFVRGESQWVNIVWALSKNHEFDFTSSKTFSFDVYLEDINKLDLNKYVNIGFRKYDAEGNRLPDLNLPNHKSVTCYGKWATYTFDLSEYTMDDLNGITDMLFYIAPSDDNLKGTGMTGYINNVRGPKIISDELVASASLSPMNNKVLVDIVSFGELTTVTTPDFTVTENGQPVAVTMVSNTERQLVLEMERKLDMDAEIIVNYNADNGTVQDENGFVLASFTQNLNEQKVVVEKEMENGIFYFYDGSTTNPLFNVNPVNQVVEVVDNPFPTAEVANAKVSKIDRKKGHRAIQYMNLLDGATIYGDRNLKFSIYVYQEGQAEMIRQNVLQFRIFTPGRAGNIVERLDVVKQDGWVKYTFDFTDFVTNNTDGTLVKESVYDTFELTFGEDIGDGGSDATIESTIYYATNFFGPHVQSDGDASLYSLMSDDMYLDGLSEGTKNFTIDVTYGAEVPQISAVANNKEAVVDIAQANSLSENTVVTVTSKDGNTTEVYTITYNESAPSMNADLKEISVNGFAISNFDPAQTEYTFTYLRGETSVPEVDAMVADETATYSIDAPMEIPGETVITVTAQNGDEKVYTLHFEWTTASDINTVEYIRVNDVAIAEFDQNTMMYEVTYPYGTTAIPTVTSSTTDEFASIDITQAPMMPGDATIEVTAQDGSVNTYTVKFVLGAPSTDATLASLSVDGQPLDNFSADVFEYNVEYPYGTTTIPELSGETSFVDVANVETNQATAMPGSASIVVTAQDGVTMLTYTVNYNWGAPSTDASITAILLDGVAMEEFEVATDNYEVMLPASTETLPVITVTTSDENATYEVSTLEGLEGEVTITITAQDGTTTSTYSINFTLEVLSDNANLTAILLDDVALEGFDADVLDYEVTVTELQTVTYTLEDETASVEVLQATAFGEKAMITVTAEDGVTVKEYTVLFKQQAPTSINDLFADIKVYGFNQVLTLSSKDGFRNNAVRIFNTNGQLVHQQKIDGTKVQIKNLRSSIYIVQLEIDGQVYVQKVIL